MKNFWKFIKTVSLLASTILVVSACGGGGGGDTTANKAVVTEVWLGSSDQGTTNTTLTKYADGTITTTGQWTYNYNGATVTCQITEGNATVTGSIVTITGTGTATNPTVPAGYQTSPFTLSLTGTMSGGQGSGTFTITFKTANWPPPISGSWTAQKQSGSGVTNMPPIQTTVPSTPTGVIALPGNGQVSISWSAVTGATSYNIYWATVPGLTKNAATKIAGVTTPYTHSGLTNDTKYYYLVTAVNSAGESDESTAASAVPTGDSVPNIVSATCVNEINGSCQSVLYSYSNGTVTGIGSFIYVKNSGGSGTINVTVKAGNYTENKQFNVTSGTQYILKSVVPIQKNSVMSALGNDLIVSASFQGVSEITKSNTISPSYVPASGNVTQHWDAYVANGTPSSTLEVDLDKTLKIITTLNSPGGSLPSDAIYTGPTGLAFDGSYLWNADWYTKKIYKIDTTGNIIASFNSPGNSPTGLAFDGTYLWNADYNANKIYKLDTAGNVIASFSSPGSRPTGLAFDGTYLWNADDMADKIYKLDTTGTVNRL